MCLGLFIDMLSNTSLRAELLIFGKLLILGELLILGASDTWDKWLEEEGRGGVYSQTLV